MYIQQIEHLLLEHCYHLGILKKTAPLKKKDAILDSLVAAIFRTGVQKEDLNVFLNEVNNNIVLNINLFTDGGNLYDYIPEKWHAFIKALWRQRSVGLGTPNAASGEGELMFVFISPQISKATRGDLLINGENIELKGEGVRVQGLISGKHFRQKTLSVLQTYKLTPNKSIKTNLDSFEIEKKPHAQYWLNVLGNLNINTQKNIINDYLKCIDDFDHIDSVENIFCPNINLTILYKEIVKIIYTQMVSYRKFDKFIILGDGTNIKIVKSTEEFKRKIDEDIIKLGSDYFRINQDMNIGWYIY